MTTLAHHGQPPLQDIQGHTSQSPPTKARRWRKYFGNPKAVRVSASSASPSEGFDEVQAKRPEKWSMGILNDRETDEVPGSVLLMDSSVRNEPLGLRNAPARTSASSLPSPFPPYTGHRSGRQSVQEKKRTANGEIILEPQPGESLNDPLNWPSWRRDVALLSLGFYCMVGGGMTPILAAGFNNVAATYHVSIPKVALTTGFYMLGLGIGSVIASPTAILFGKRPVYLVGIILFLISSVWCAVSPNYTSLVVARIFMGIAVSPCECLPSATIAEIFFLHERAYRLGVYTLLLLGGKNLVPLVSAVIIQSLGWRWVFWIVTMVVGLCFALLFFFVPETFWDRTPRPSIKSRKSTIASISNLFQHSGHGEKDKSEISVDGPSDIRKLAIENSALAERRQARNSQHVGFVSETGSEVFHDTQSRFVSPAVGDSTPRLNVEHNPESVASKPSSPAGHSEAWRVEPSGLGPKTPALHNLNSPYYLSKERDTTDYVGFHDKTASNEIESTPGGTNNPKSVMSNPHDEKLSATPPYTGKASYTAYQSSQPPKTFVQTLRPWNGRLRKDNWLKVAFRPFILFVYPSILWSTLVYSLSVGWLIVLSESVASIYRNKATYNFSALGTGLVYISPFIGGVLGTAVAGKVSDVIVRFMARRNGGLYEPEYRLVMAIPVAIATSIGLMGFGWSAQERDKWIVPTIFFGIISFGCALGSTTAITFAVDSYRQYAGEALVTLNFSKNVFHGLIFSLFFTKWLESDGSKNVFLAIGGIQVACLLTTIPMYIYGKRMRMWTVRKNFMEKF